MVDRTIDDVSSVASDDNRAEPRIALVATGAQAMSLVLPAHAELGRRIAAEGHAHEIADERMSRDHATVRWERGTWTIRDLDSRNGTYVEGERISGEVKRRGDLTLRLGHTLFVLLEDGRGHPGAAPAERAAGGPDADPVVGPELARVYDQIRRHATSATLLIHGETGSGKELAARLYHEAGPRKAGPFVALNCAAIQEGLAEGLLFGTRKGAFTDAVDRLGHFQLADKGTLFLDEIADLPAPVQTKLLRVIEDRQIPAVGGKLVPIDIGLVAASHRELRTAIADGSFRQDLFFRLQHPTVHLPPLRKRRVDLVRLIQREIAAAKTGVTPHAKLLESCLLRPWPGNVRELRAAIRRAATEAVAAGRDVVKVEDLVATDGMPVGSQSGDTAVERRNVSPAEIDKEAVLAALQRANGVIAVAARTLGLHRNQFYRLMEKHGIVRDESQ